MTYRLFFKRAICPILTTFLALAPALEARAGFFDDIGNTFESVGRTFTGTVESGGQAVMDMGDALDTHVISPGLREVGDGFENAGNVLDEEFRKAGEALERETLNLLLTAAEAAVEQVGEPLENMALLWARFAREQAESFESLIDAIERQDSHAIAAVLVETLQTISEFGGFDALMQDFRDANAGSLLLVATAGGGAGAMVSAELGVAIDIDAIPYLAAGNIGALNGAIGSLFTAGGLQVGPAAGGGADFVIGYDLSDPASIFGPGMNFSLGIKSKVGGSFNAGYNLAVFPPQLNSLSVGVGAGLKLQASAGPGYTGVLGQLCSDGSLQEFASACPVTAAAPVQVSQIHVSGSQTLCVHKGHGVANNTVVHLWTGCAPHDNNSWIYDNVTGLIRSGENQAMCLHKIKRGWADDNALHLYECKKGPAENKTWTLEPATGFIRSRVDARYCVQTRGAAIGESTKLGVGLCDQPAANNQVWDISAN